MATSAGQHAIDIQDHDTPAPLHPTAAENPIGRCCKAILLLGFALVMMALVAYIFVMLIILIAFGGGPTEYSAAIAAGAPESSGAAIPALFNLTVHIKNPSRLSEACVWSDATAVVSYGGATIGAGVVPWFCAGKREEREVVVPVWGVGAGADVTLPRALQSRDAVVDVVVRMQQGAGCSRYPQVLSCSVRVGGAPSLCTPSCV